MLNIINIKPSNKWQTIYKIVLILLLILTFSATIKHIIFHEHLLTIITGSITIFVSSLYIKHKDNELHIWSLFNSVIFVIYIISVFIILHWNIQVPTALLGITLTLIYIKTIKPTYFQYLVFTTNFILIARFIFNILEHHASLSYALDGGMTILLLISISIFLSYTTIYFTPINKLQLKLKKGSSGSKTVPSPYNTQLNVIYSTTLIHNLYNISKIMAKPGATNNIHIEITEILRLITTTKLRDIKDILKHSKRNINGLLIYLKRKFHKNFEIQFKQTFKQIQIDYQQKLIIQLFASIVFEAILNAFKYGQDIIIRVNFTKNKFQVSIQNKYTYETQHKIFETEILKLQPLISKVAPNKIELVSKNFPAQHQYRHIIKLSL